MKLLRFLLLAIACLGIANGQTARLVDFPTLSAAPASNDWIYLYDTSAGFSVKISPANLLSSRQPLSTNLTEIGALSPSGAHRLLGYENGTGHVVINLGSGLTYNPSTDTLSATATGGGWVYEGVWVTATAYQAGDVVTNAGGSYVCIADHTSGASTEAGVGASSGTVWGVLSSGGAGTGDVTAAAPFGTDNRILRSDGTGKGSQSSLVSIDDSGNISTPGNITVNELITAVLRATTFGLVDTNASHYLQLAAGSDLTANRNLTFTTGDAARTLTLQGNPTLDDWFNQSVKTSASPTFVGVTVDAETYGAGWSGDPTVARKSDLYTKIESMGGSSGPSIDTFRQNPFYWEDYLLGGTPAAGAFVGDFSFTKSTSGSGATTSNDVGQTNAPGIATVTSGTTTTGYSYFNTYSSAFHFGGASYTLEGRFYIPTLRDGTEDYSFVFGFHDVTTAAATDGCYFLYDNASANWQIVNRSNATGSPTASAVAVAATTWVRLRVVVNSAANSVSYFVDGTELAVSPLTSNIPTAVNRQTGVRWGIVKSAGTTAREIWCDYIGLQIGLSAAR